MKSSSDQKSLSWLLVAALAVALTTGSVEAQAVGTITGSVTDAATGQPVAGVQVHIPALQLGALSNAQGRFLLLNVPAGTHEVRAELIGRQSVSVTAQLQPGGTAEVNLRLESSAISLGGVVVTGVAGATPRSQLAFTVEQVQVSPAAVSTALNASSLLQGRMAGATVIQGTGQPGDEASIQLRGPTSIMGSQAPLLIVDGVITHGGLSSIDPNDIESMEVVKGAAAASLYGSRAQAGVIEVTTKRGSGVRDGSTQFTMRGSYMANDVPYLMRMSLSHEYQMNPEGTRLLLRNGEEVDLRNNMEEEFNANQLALNGYDGSTQNPFKAFQDQVIPADIFGGSPFEQLMTPGNAYTTYYSIAGNAGDTQYRLSARNTRDEGAIAFHEGSKQHNYRLNIDHRISPSLSLSAGAYLAWMNQDVIFQNEAGGLSFISDFGDEPSDPTGASGGGASRGIFKLIDESRAAGNYFGWRNADGDLLVVGDPISRRGNPLHIVQNQDWTRDRQRTMAVLDLQYEPLSGVTLQANVAHDRADLTETNVMPAPWERRAPLPPSMGAMFVMSQIEAATNASVTASLARSLGDVTVRSRLRYLAELSDTRTLFSGGETFAAGGVPRLGLLTTGIYNDSFEQPIRSEGVFAATAVTWRDRYIADALIRRDGSSLFGPAERWQTYFRLAGAWRMAQEEWWPFASVTEFRPRYSIGTAGGRPRFDYQYQTYDVARGRIVPLILGNANLKPELATERELGVDVVFRDAYRLQASYVNTRVEDQLLIVSPSAWLGFQGQWRNAGTVSAKTWELSLEAAFVERPDLLWTGRLSVDRTRQKITQLNVPPFEMREVRARIRIAEGEELGSFYGSVFARSCADLRPGTPCDQFQVNDDGLLVWVGSHDYRDGVTHDLWGGSATLEGQSYGWGMPSFADGRRFEKLGSAEPDLNVSFLQDLQWRSFGFTGLFTSQIGGMIYNQSRHWGARAATGPIDQFGKSEGLKKPMPYYGLGLYHRNDRSDWWVESGTNVKLKELSARYTIDRSTVPGMLGKLGVDRVTLALVGRNVLTWSGYLGHDPEVGRSTLGGSASIGRIDEYMYPNLRQFGFDVEFVF